MGWYAHGWGRVLLGLVVALARLASPVQAQDVLRLLEDGQPQLHQLCDSRALLL